MRIRTASPADAGALVSIYSPYVENTSVTFEYVVPSVEEFAKRISSTLQNYPYLVAEKDGCILGYCYASSFKTRAAYHWSATPSIYVAAGCHGQGVGRALYQAMEEILLRQHVCNLCACITYPNPDSIAFHTSFGYQKVAHFHQSGYKLGIWHDMIWMEKTLCPHQIPPLPFIPYSELCGQHGKEHL